MSFISLFMSIMKLFVQPLTLAIGLIGNMVSIFVLRRTKEIQLRDAFARILIALAVFDIIFLIATGLLFSISNMSEGYQRYVHPYMVLIMLPIAQIAMTASVYMTVVTCFDRYIAICRPAVLSTLCCSGEENTSWCLIIGTGIFSLLYNFSRFFEYSVKGCPEENGKMMMDGKLIWRMQDGELHMGTTPGGELKWTTKIPLNASIDTIEHNVSKMLGSTNIMHEPYNECQMQMQECPCALQTDIRQDLDYKLYYLTICNGIFMGVIPMALMIFFNILVVRAVNEANRKRARMTLRHQRNITITGLLVAVVIVFLVCHSLKLLLNCYEVYVQILSPADVAPILDKLKQNATQNFPDYQFSNQYTSPTVSTSTKVNVNENGTQNSATNVMESNIRIDPSLNSLEDMEEEGEELTYVNALETLSHWLLIVNSSCNIVIYLHKDPKFKEALTQMILSWIPLSESARHRLAHYGRGKDHHNEDGKSDGQGQKLNTYDEGEYVESVAPLTKTTAASDNNVHVGTMKSKDKTIIDSNDIDDDDEASIPLQSDVV